MQNPLISANLVGQPLTVESDIVQGELKVTPQVGTMFRLVAIASFKLLSNETIDPKPAIGAPAFSRPKRLARSLRVGKIATKASRSPLRGVLMGAK
jgi:hypothetical protein